MARSKFPYKIVLNFLLGIILLGLVFAAISWYSSCQRKISCSDSANTVPLRDVFVLLDQSASVKYPNKTLLESQQSLKNQIQENIFANLGIGDRISAFRIDACFHEVDDRIIKNNHNIPLVCHKANHRPANELRNSFIDSLSLKWQKLALLKQIWAEELDSLVTSPEEGKYSDYYGALAAIEDQVLAAKEEGVPEIWLIIIGDLDHQRGNNCVEEHVSGRKSFDDVRIRMLYPAGSVKNRPQKVGEWKSLFRKLGGTDFNAQNLSSFSGEFKPSSIPGLSELKQGKSFCLFH